MDCKKIIFIFITVLLLGSSFCVFAFYPTRIPSDASLKVSNPMKLEGPTMLIDDSDPNYDWSITSRRKIWCTGSGSKSDPYVINNVMMDGTGLDAGLYIRSSSKYFVVQDCAFYNSKVGIKLEKVNNGKILQNNCSLNEIGISTYRSHYLVISNNNLNENEYIGLFLKESYYNTITENRANKNLRCGIKIESCYGSTISNNYATYNTQDGIRLQNSYDNKIKENLVEYNNEHGISLDESYQNELSNNIARDNKGFSGGGIYLALSNENIVFENELKNNEVYGLDIQTSHSNSIYNNDLISNNKYGIILYDSKDNYILENEASNNGIGICLVNSDNNRIVNNTFHDNGQCTIEEEQCEGNTFSGNTCFQLFPSVSGYDLQIVIAIIGVTFLIIIKVRRQKY